MKKSVKGYMILKNPAKYLHNFFSNFYRSFLENHKHTDEYLKAEKACWDPTNILSHLWLPNELCEDAEQIGLRK